MHSTTVTTAVIGLMGLLLLPLLTGCTEDDCVTCVAEPPVAPTQVFSASGDGRITVYWNDYPEFYSDEITGYVIWSRFFEPGDQNDPAREFYYLDEIEVGQNYDPDTGQYFYVDTSVDNAVDYEYAVSTVSRHGESYLSFEFVVDTPLPMSETPLTLFDVDGPNGQLSGFDFSLAGEHGGGGGNGADGVVDPGLPGHSADVRVRFDAAGVPWLETMRGDVHVQDYGTFLDELGRLYFEGCSWAPEFGWSESGVVELITGHIYVIEIYNEPTTGDVHYAKLGVVGVDQTARTVRIMWAYQLVNGLPELAAPEPRVGSEEQPRAIRL
jgi:hypothetical protein